VTSSTSDDRGRWLAELRLRRGHTQESLADILSVDPGTVARWERGAQGIRTRNEAALANALGVTLAKVRRSPAAPIEVTDAAISPLDVPEVADYVDSSDVEKARKAMQELIRLDNEIGTGGLIAPSTQLLGVLRNRLQSGAVTPNAEADLCANRSSSHLWQALWYDTPARVWSCGRVVMWACVGWYWPSSRPERRLVVFEHPRRASSSVSRSGEIWRRPGTGVGRR
jgi:transcriptional regulator with XRE-family HTH domain